MINYFSYFNKRILIIFSLCNIPSKFFRLLNFFSCNIWLYYEWWQFKNWFMYNFLNISWEIKQNSLKIISSWANNSIRSKKKIQRSFSNFINCRQTTQINVKCIKIILLYWNVREKLKKVSLIWCLNSTFSLIKNYKKVYLKKGKKWGGIAEGRMNKKILKVQLKRLRVAVSKQLLLLLPLKRIYRDIMIIIFNHSKT